MTYTTTVSTPAAPATEPTQTTAAPTLEMRLQAALEHARRLTEMRGTADIEVAIAWETVEELQVARARKREKTLTTFAQYCIDYPEAPECRLYED
ncbi:MAG: Calvin cycle protein CP12 [Cyanobacteria bacterium P01_C01_bin.120]